MNNFSQLATEYLAKPGKEYYVYALVDPRNKRIFYIGKGTGGRVFAHVNEALDNPNIATDKLNLIREIKSEGYEVLQYIVRSGMTGMEAFKLESVLIDLLTFDGFNFKTELSNIVSGHHNEDESMIMSQFKTTILTSKELNDYYATEKLTNFKHRVMAININKTYKNKDKTERHPGIYEAVRKSWRINPNRADQAEYILAEYKGVVRAVFRLVGKWYLANEKVSKTRWMFDGEEVKDEHILNLYLNKVIGRKHGNMSPVRYFNFDTTKENEA